MSTFFVFIMTLAELLAIAAGHFLHIPALLDNFVVYGSPPFIIMNTLSNNTVAFTAHPFFPLLALFHVLKYLFLCRSQFVMDRYSLHYLAVIFEVSYLIICAFYL